MIRIGDTYINLRNVTHTSFFKAGAKEQATIYYGAETGYDSSHTRLEGEEAVGLKWYLDQKAFDVVAERQEALDTKAKAEEYRQRRTEIRAAIHAQYPAARDMDTSNYAAARSAGDTEQDFADWFREIHSGYYDKDYRAAVLGPDPVVSSGGEEGGQEDEAGEVPF